MQLGSVEWQGIVDRLANWSQLPAAEVARRIRLQFIDVTRLRAANDMVIAGSIALSAGPAIVTNAAAMLRAAGTTSVRLRSYIAGNFSKRDELVSHARMAHTEEGSYIVPILMPLPVPEPSPVTQPQILGVEDIPTGYEAPQRRITRTLAQALAALDAHVIQPAREVRRNELHGFVEAGGSRELVVAVRRVLAEPAVASFEVSLTGQEQWVRRRPHRRISLFHRRPWIC